MRQDLFYRLHAHHLHLPPLRERSGDLPALVHHFIAEAAADLQLPIPPLTAQALDTIRAHAWPGNIRELAAAINAAVGRGRGSGLVFEGLQPQAPARSETGFPETLPTLDEMKDRLITEALRRSDGNIVEASRILGISRWGLSKRLKHAP